MKQHGQGVQPAGHRGRALPRVGGVRRLQGTPRGGQKAVYHRDAPAQHHRSAAHGPRHGRRAAGQPDPLPPHEGRSDALAAGHRPRLHRHGGQDRGGDAQGGPDQGGRGPRGLPRARMGLEERVRRTHRAPDPPHGQQLRLEPRALHHGRGLLEGRHRGVQPPVRKGPHLPRQPHDQLVPLLPHLHLRRGGGIRGAERQLLAPALPGQGDRRDARAGDDPSGDDARRHRRGHQRGGPALCASARLSCDPAAGGQGDPDRLRRAR